MKEEVKDRWVAALRSGDYLQGSGALCCDGKFCCLGVLCEVLGVARRDAFGLKGYGEYEAVSFLPEEVVRTTSMASNRGLFEHDGGSQSLSRLNDNGSTFGEIADVIERVWPEL